MSSRQLRKLQKQRELAQATKSPDPQVEESSEDDDPVPAAKPRVSLFAALGGGDEDQDEEEEEEGQQQDDGQAQEEEEEAQSTQPAKKSKKKKKKKKKAAAKAAAEATPEEDDQDEIDRAIRELNIAKQQRGGDAVADEQPAASLRINELLSINTYHLKAINEMRNLFGRDVIESANAEEEEETTRRRRGGAAQQHVDLETFLRGPPNAKKLPEVSLRRNVFIQGREHWPRATSGGLTMVEVEKADDGSFTEWAYVYDTQYDSMQGLFFSYVQMGNPMTMVHLLGQVPYHVSTLLQVSSVAKQDQNMAFAAELCERALFAFGRVATSAFRQDLEHGRARLDFRRPENRQLWLAGYHYLKSLIRKGTYRTALEWAKLLFSFDHQDPYAMRHFIHFLAIRAYEARWLVDFMDELEKTSENRDTIYLRQTLVLAKLQLGDTEGARAELKAGMQQVPWLYCAFYQELGLDAPPSIWGINADSDSRSFWTKLYTYQTKDLWNNTAAISLLQQVAKSLEKVDKTVLPVDDPAPDLGATRFVFLEGQTSIIAVAPRKFLDSQPNYEFDPLPPPEEENIFTGQGCRMPWLDQNPNARALDNQLGAQLQALLERRAARAQARAGGAAGGAGAGGILGGFTAEDEDEELDAVDLDDPELARDLEEHARRANQPGIVQTLMRMLRGEPAPEGEFDDREEEERYEDFESPDEGGVPGAWPDEDEHERR